MSLLLPLLLCLPIAATDAEVEADYVLRGATIYDGTGAKGLTGDLAIRGERIVAVGKFTVAGTPRVIDAKGLIVAPGFIDLHTHSDDALTQAKTNANLCYVYQGVTTVVTGNCGFGPSDVGGYFKKLEKAKTGTNVIHQVPHNAVREAVMKNANRPPTADELQKMEALAILSGTVPAVPRDRLCLAVRARFSLRLAR